MNFVSKAKVINVIEIKDDIREYIVKLDKEVRYSPGSFVQLTLSEVSASDIWPESRTFSIASYKKGVMHFIIKNVGNYTNRIFKELINGSYCTLKYPFGNLFDKTTADGTHVLIAGGLGITPYLGLLDYFESINKMNNVYLFYSVKYEGDLIHYIALKEKLGERLVIYITQEFSANYINRRVEIEDIEKLVDNSSHIYICGSKSFGEDLKKKFIEHGYTSLSMDEWD